MPIAIALAVGAIASMLVSMWGAVKLGYGPDAKWSAVMWGGLAATYVTSIGFGYAMYLASGQRYYVLVALPLALTVAAFRAQKQSREHRL